MNQTPFRVVIGGAGVAALEAALALRALAEDLVSVQLVAPESEFTYRPLAVAEPFRAGEVRRFPLVRLVEAAGAELLPGKVLRVDPSEKRATLDDGRRLDFGAFVLALGAEPKESVPGALTFRGPEDEAALSTLLDRGTTGELHRVVFVVPSTVTWPMPAYELALLTATYFADRGTRNVEIVLATPEERPLAVFGVEGSAAMSELLQVRGIDLMTNAAAVAYSDGSLQFAGEVPSIEADAVVALPRLAGPAFAGLPHDRAGFVPVDQHFRVSGTTDVYAAGDCTTFPLKQGGIAAQQADLVAAEIAADLGSGGEPPPFRPVVRGLLLTGFVPRFLRSETGSGHAVVDTEQLWWPPAKIVGRYFTPFIASQLGLGAAAPSKEVHPGAVEVEVEVDPSHTWTAL
jgi:sulfide:quinone oxidoreductase